MERHPEKAGRAYPEAAHVGKLWDRDMMLSLATVPLRMWWVLQGIEYPGTQSGLTEVYLPERSVACISKAFLPAGKDLYEEPREVPQRTDRSHRAVLQDVCQVEL